MQKLLILLSKGLKKFSRKIRNPFDWAATYCKFYFNGVENSNFTSHGIPKINVSLGGKFEIGEDFRINNIEIKTKTI